MTLARRSGITTSMPQASLPQALHQALLYITALPPTSSRYEGGISFVETLTISLELDYCILKQYG
jgi:hypothetical protein